MVRFVHQKTKLTIQNFDEYVGSSKIDKQKHGPLLPNHAWSLIVLFNLLFGPQTIIFFKILFQLKYQFLKPVLPNVYFPYDDNSLKLHPNDASDIWQHFIWETW